MTHNRGGAHHPGTRLSAPRATLAAWPRTRSIPADRAQHGANDCYEKLLLVTPGLDQPAGRGGGPVPLVDITAEQISFDDTALTTVAAVVGDTSPSWKIEPLYERAPEEQTRLDVEHGRSVVTVTGPVAIRPIGTTPMKVVNRAAKSVAAWPPGCATG